MDRNVLDRNSRMAGMVKRYHTHPTTQQQTIAEHTWQAMRIWYLVWGPLPPDISSAMLWHDAAELVTGDLPHRSKKLLPGHIREVLKEMEYDAVFNMGGPARSEITLSQNDKFRIKFCDLVEMLEFGIIEMAFHNPFGAIIVEACQLMLPEIVDAIDPKDVGAAEKYLNKVYDTARKLGVEVDPA